MVGDNDSGGAGAEGGQVGDLLLRGGFCVNGDRDAGSAAGAWSL